MNTPNDHQVDRQAPKGEKSETLNREDETTLSSAVDMQYNVNLSMKVSVQAQIPRRAITMVPRRIVKKYLVRPTKRTYWQKNCYWRRVNNRQSSQSTWST